MKNERIKYNLQYSRPAASQIQPDFFDCMDSALTAVIIAENMPAIAKHFYKIGFADGQNNFFDRDIGTEYEKFLTEVLGMIEPEK